MMRRIATGVERLAAAAVRRLFPGAPKAAIWPYSAAGALIGGAAGMAIVATAAVRGLF